MCCGPESRQIRAARHYESAAQLLIGHAVMSARQFIRVQACAAPPIGAWIEASAPARIDLAGAAA